MKTLIKAAVVTLIATASFADQKIDSAVFDYAATLNKHYQYNNSFSKSHIDVHGAYGNDTDSNDPLNALKAIHSRVDQGSESQRAFKFYNYTRRNEDSHDNGWESSSTDKDTERDHFEYVVKNGDRVLIIAELNDGDYSTAFNSPGTNNEGFGGNTATDNRKAEYSTVSSQESYDKTQNWIANFGDVDAPRLVVESNYNSKRYYADIQEYDKIDSTPEDDDTDRIKIWELDVAHVASNEQAKQVVAATAALLFNKFNNISGADAKNIIWNNSDSKWDNKAVSGHSRQFNHSTVQKVLSPSGKLF